MTDPERARWGYVDDPSGTDVDETGIVESSAIEASTELYLSESRIASLTVLLIGFFLLVVGSGIQYPLLALRGTEAGFSVLVTGLFTTAYYVGFLFGSVWAPHVILRVGHIRLYAALASISAAAILFVGVFTVPSLWIASRFVSGLCFAGIFVVVESWLITETTIVTRGKVMSTYMIVNLGALGVAQFLLNVPESTPMLPFVIASVLLSLAVVPTALGPSAGPGVLGGVAVRFRGLWRAAPLAIVTCAVAGAGYGTILGLAAVYGAAAEMSTFETSLFLVAAIAGGGATTLPVGHLSDTFDRRWMILACATAAVLAALAAGFAGVAAPIALLMILLFAVGGANFPLYPLGIAHLSDYIDTDKLLAASARLVLIFGAGAAVGPFIAGLMMDYWTPNAFFWLLGIVHAVVVGYGVYIVIRRRAALREKRREFLPVTSTATPQVATFVQDTEVS